MDDLFGNAAAELAARSIQPARELGAYEALWAQKRTTLKSLARVFRAHPRAVPSDFVTAQDAERHTELALAGIRRAGINDFGIRVNGAGEHPRKLRDAAHPVELLYFQGHWEISAAPCVAIVGTRTPSEEGKRRAARLARQIAKLDYVVVSGLAAGIDTVAHTAALEARGRTIAVLGTPITTTYPPENASLQKRIAGEHLVISQVPVVRYSRQSAHWNRLFFPERNATMSALSDATVMVEAGNTSGALIQARHALDQGRPLFILDHCFEDPDLSWPGKFLERGAIRVASCEDIRGHLAARAVHSDRRSQSRIA